MLLEPQCTRSISRSHYPWLLSISTRLGPGIVVCSFLTKTQRDQTLPSLIHRIIWPCDIQFWIIWLQQHFVCTYILCIYKYISTSAYQYISYFNEAKSCYINRVQSYFSTSNHIHTNYKYQHFRTSAYQYISISVYQDISVSLVSTLLTSVYQHVSIYQHISISAPPILLLFQYFQPCPGVVQWRCEVEATL